MPQDTNYVATPRYVLKSGGNSIHPTIVLDTPETKCVCVYGFSGKKVYDKFIESTDQKLTPYPLVKRFLSNQGAEKDSGENNESCLGLVILDATEISQPLISATSMSTVQSGQRDNAEQVPVEYELEFDAETSSYLIKSGL